MERLFIGAIVGLFTYFLLPENAKTPAVTEKPVTPIVETPKEETAIDEVPATA